MWKVPSHPEYFVTKEGKVFGPKGERALVSDKAGYLTVVLKNPLKCFKVHRLVAEGYCKNPDNLTEVHHKDGDKRNNHFSNLEWITRKGNQEASFSLQYSIISPEGQVFKGLNYNEVSRKFGLNPGNISRLMRGLQKSHKGWRRFDD